MGTRVFAFTYAGKPLFTNCPEGEQSLAFYGVLCAVASKVSTLLSEYTSKDELRYISAGDEHFVYLDRGPLCYFGIGPKGESPLMVYKVLSYLHLQILSILTRGVERVLLKRPSYDVQNLLGGTQSILQNLVTSMDSPLSLLDTRGYEALPLPADTRSKLSSFFTDFKSPNVLCCLMVVCHRVVVVTMSKSVTLSPSDIAIILLMVGGARALRQEESWTPICLPGFNDQAFTYAYVNCVQPHIAVICISSSGDQELFHKISEHVGRVTKQMTDSGLLDRFQLPLVSLQLEVFCGEDPSCAILHVLYYSKKLGQFFSSAFRNTPFGDNADVIRAAYKSFSEFLFSKEEHGAITARFECVNVYVENNPEFSLYFATAAWTSVTTELVSRIVSYVNKQFRFLFITRIPSIVSR